MYILKQTSENAMSKLDQLMTENKKLSVLNSELEILSQKLTLELAMAK